MKAFAALIISIFTVLTMNAQNSNQTLLIGTYTNGKSEGIYSYSFNAITGESELLSKATDVSNPSFLAVSADKMFVYAVNEDDDGGLSSFSFNSANGSLKFINKVATKGAHPCYVAVPSKGKHVFAGNYSGGSLAVSPVSADGKLSELSQFIQHEGNSINKGRQEKAHVHITLFSPDEKFLLVADLGTDKVSVYKYEPSKSQPLTLFSDVSVKAGSGPRHLTFHPNGNIVYLVQELSAEITAFEFKDGNLKALQTVPMMPADFTGENGAADIHISPDGKFLYASNRGDANQLVIFAIDDSKSGNLTFKGRQSTLGKTPRNFTMDPLGNFLLVANQESDNVIIFKRNKETGALTDTGKRIEVGAPVCLVLSES